MQKWMNVKCIFIIVKKGALLVLAGTNQACQKIDIYTRLLILISLLQKLLSVRSNWVSDFPVQYFDIPIISKT